jgi:hypothetical protein
MWKFILRSAGNTRQATLNGLIRMAGKTDGGLISRLLRGTLRSQYAASSFREKVFSAALCVSRRSSAVTVISPQSALRIRRGPQRRKALVAVLLSARLRFAFFSADFTAAAQRTNTEELSD